jgi:hypothetical protein
MCLPFSSQAQPSGIIAGKGVVDEAHRLSVGASIRLRALQKAATTLAALRAALPAGLDPGNARRAAALRAACREPRWRCCSATAR